jgi:hypothetical protein
VFDVDPRCSWLVHLRAWVAELEVGVGAIWWQLRAGESVKIVQVLVSVNRHSPGRAEVFLGTRVEGGNSCDNSTTGAGLKYNDWVVGGSWLKMT